MSYNLTRCPGPYGSHVNLNIIIIISIIVVLVVRIIHRATATPQRYIFQLEICVFSLLIWTCVLGMFAIPEQNKLASLKQYRRNRTPYDVMCTKQPPKKVIAVNYFFTHPPQPTSRNHSKACKLMNNFNSAEFNKLVKPMQVCNLISRDTFYLTYTIPNIRIEINR